MSPPFWKWDSFGCWRYEEDRLFLLKVRLEEICQLGVYFRSLELRQLSQSYLLEMKGHRYDVLLWQDLDLPVGKLMWCSSRGWLIQDASIQPTSRDQTEGFHMLLASFDPPGTGLYSTQCISISSFFPAKFRNCRWPWQEAGITHINIIRRCFWRSW